MEKEHFEVILEDINSKIDLIVENIQSLRDKMDEYNLDSIRRDEEIKKLLQFAKEDSDRRNDETTIKSGFLARMRSTCGVFICKIFIWKIQLTGKETESPVKKRN